MANQPGDEESSEPVVETRVFDIRSLLLDVPDYRAVFSDLRSDDIYAPPPEPHAKATGSVFQGPSEPPSKPQIVKPDVQQQKADDLMNIIRNTVDMESWFVNGGVIGSLHYYGGQLVITQTAEAMADVERLLNLLKESRSRKLRVEVRFVLVPSKGAAPAVSQLGSSKTISAKDLQAAVDAQSDDVSVFRASVSGFEGQRVYATAGKQHSVIVGADAIVATGSSAIVPVPRQLVSGVTLEVQAVRDTSQNTVLVDLRASLGALIGEFMKGDEPATGDPIAASIAVRPYQVANFATSVSLPVGQYSLVGECAYDDQHDVLLFVMPSDE